MSSIPIKSPAGFAVSQATAFADADGTALLVSAAAPLPVQVSATVPLAVAVAGTVAISNATLAVNVSNAAPLAVSVAATTTAALAGAASASGVVGPFTPVLGRAAILALAGGWAGTVKVTRSTDGGATRLPLTVAGSAWAQFSGNACEPVWEESDATARLYLDLTLTSGTLNYRLSQ